MKRLFIVVVASVIFVACAVCVKNEWGRKLYGNANYGMEALVKKGFVQNLFIGSSMFRQGIDIFAVEKTLGEESFILAYNGNQPVYEYMELEYLLENGVKIENVYLDMYAYSAAATPKISDARLLAHTDTKFKRDVWKMLCSCGETKLSVFWELFVTANNETFLTFPISNKLTDRLYHKGGNVQKNTGSTSEKLFEKGVPKARGKMNDFQKESLWKIISLCKKNEIALYFIETPKWVLVSEDKDYQDLMREFVLLCEENTSPFCLSQKTADCLGISGANVIAFDSENPTYFIDTVHMSSTGRELYSSLLMK